MNLIPDFNAKVLCAAVQIRILKWMFDSIRFGADSFWNLIDSLDSGGFWWILVDSNESWWILAWVLQWILVWIQMDTRGCLWILVDS